MMAKKQDVGYWMGWAVSFALAGALLVYLISEEPSVYRFFCSEADTNCGREWWAALGGYAAIAVAIPTILYMQRQVVEAGLHHRQTLLIALRQKIESARAAVEIASDYERKIPAIEKALRTADIHDRDPYRFTAILSGLTFVHNESAALFLSDAPVRIQSSRALVLTCIELANEYAEMFWEATSVEAEDELLDDVVEEVQDAVRYANKLAQEYRVAGEDYLAEMDSLLRPHS